MTKNINIFGAMVTEKKVTKMWVEGARSDGAIVTYIPGCGRLRMNVEQ